MSVLTPDSLSFHCELFIESSNSQGADSTSNIFCWISCRVFNQGIRPTPRTATQSSWLRGSWLPSGIGATWLDAQGEGTVCGLFIFYWTLSTSKPRNVSVKAMADTSQSTIRPQLPPLTNPQSHSGKGTQGENDLTSCLFRAKRCNTRGIARPELKERAPCDFCFNF